MTQSTVARPSLGWRTPLVVTIAGCMIAMVSFGPRSSLGQCNSRRKACRSAADNACVKECRCVCHGTTFDTARGKFKPTYFA